MALPSLVLRVLVLPAQVSERKASMETDQQVMLAEEHREQMQMDRCSMSEMAKRKAMSLHEL